MTSVRRILLLTAAAIIGPLLGWLVHVAHQPAPPVNVDDIVKIGGRFVQRPDGRVLEYFVCGDPNGTILYAQHGYGSTGLAYYNPYICDVATKLGLRIISITLPGFGLSDPIVNDNILQVWPEQVNAILKKEGVSDSDGIYVTGESMGCIYGAAVAASSSRIRGATFFTPPAPDSILKQLNIELPLESRLIKSLLPIPYIGDIVSYSFCYGMPVESRLQAMPDVAAALQKMEDQHYEGIKRHFIEDLRHSCHQSHFGFQTHLQVFRKDWPIELSNITASKILITSAPDDTTNPPRANEWFAHQIDGSKLLQMEAGWGHLHCVFPAAIEKVWSEMVSSESRGNE